MSPWQRSDALTDTERLEVLDLINRTETATGREALDETRRRGVVHGWHAEHWLRRSEGRLIQYAVLEYGVIPTIELCGGGFDDELRVAVLAVHPHVHWWIRDDSSSTGRVVRRLQVLSLEIPDLSPFVPEGTIIRSFVPGVDETKWLEQNNAAFTNHPEQGAWHIDDLRGRINEPWFDPSGFLLLDIGGVIAATCWTKVHELYRERLGEIYVLSVDPAFQGRGLGRTMLHVGLRALRQKGVKRSILFVDASNEDALRLYHETGFMLEREDLLLHFAND